LLAVLVNRFFLLPYLFFRKRRKLYLASAACLIAALAAGFYFASVSFQQGRARRMPPHRMYRFAERPVPPPIYANLTILALLVLGFDTGLVFYSKWTRGEQKKLREEKESLSSKMSFLQHQLSPHFFMNTLNNIHSLIDIDTEEAKDAVIRLSRMMAYMLYESQTDKIPLHRELEFVKSYVELMRLRLAEDVKVALDIPEDLPEAAVPPLLTISFIENAFKHGVSYERDSFIFISYSVSEKHLSFFVKNSRHSRPEQKKYSGIGLQNARSRLELLYGTDYSLDIKENDSDVFEVNLKIPL
ncbi:MAG: histidine kinase, partial [Cytophagales bacterium]|nr:histidine kinase [Cytophagales bacterium]